MVLYLCTVWGWKYSVLYIIFRVVHNVCSEGCWVEEKEMINIRPLRDEMIELG
jgi:hypothetical protein